MPAGGGSGPSERSPRPRHARLPAWSDRFVGRDAELATLAGLLSRPRTRLLTLTGPPGIGKTRLAVACSSTYADQHGGQVAFVDLAPLRDPDLVLPELARALGVDTRRRAGLVDALAAATAREDRLVVLDNCEHLLSAAPELAQVLAACDRVRLLATSRERLRLAAEQEFPVPPLAMPATGTRDLDTLAANPSVALLVDRARRTNPGFALTDRNAASVVASCLRLEGLPLAIELAAARLKLLTPGELAFRLGNRMLLLASATRDVPVRQRALRTAISWSHDLLSPAERTVFRRLSVFAGGWAFADAEGVCALPGTDLPAVLESLLDKSLVRRASADGEAAEFSMLDSLREYAEEQLTASGETAATRTAHAAHYAALAEWFEAAIGTPEERAWLARAGRYGADLRAALQHCLSAGQRGEALRLAGGLGWYCYTRGDPGYGDPLVQEALGSADGPAPSGALIGGGILAWCQGDLDRAEPALLRALGDSDRAGDLRRATIARAFLGHVARARGRYEESARWHEQALSGFQRLGNPQGVAWARHDLGLLARDRGRLDEAVTLLRAGLRDFRDLDYPWAVAWSAWGLGTALSAAGSWHLSAPLLGEALHIYSGVNDPRGALQCLEGLAEVAAEQGAYETAARLAGAAAAQRTRVAAPTSEADRARARATEQTLVRPLGVETVERLRQAGRAMPFEEAARLAAEVAGGRAPGDPDRGLPTVLTPRERQVATLVSSGRTNRQIGRALGISEKTTEVHLHHVMTKLAAHSRAEVAAWAASHDLHAAPT